MLSKEELLIDRFKISNIWPDMGNYGMYQGQIIELEKLNSGGFGYPTKGNTLYKSFFENYPHLFQPLPWWSDRKVEDMPEYVKTWNALKDKCIIRKVGDDSQWLYAPDGNGSEILSGLSIGDNSLLLMHYVEPSTREEYEQWKQSNK